MMEVAQLQNKLFVQQVTYKLSTCEGEDSVDKASRSLEDRRTLTL